MYDFRTLSPLDFEELVRDLLQAELGIRLQSFGPGKDLGIDFRFAWGNKDAIVQAKHYRDADTKAIARVANKENPKIAKLTHNRYIFVTSASLTPQGKTKIIEALPNARLSNEDVLGREDLNNFLGRHPEIEKQHFKLWLASTAVLERILHSGVYNRTQAEMEEIKSMVPKFVSNKSVLEAEAILKKHGTLIIAGEPGIGKSTLARMLVWLHAEQDWRISVIDDISEAFEIADGQEKRLVFFDDFLGQVGLTRDLIRGVDARFPPFFRRVQSNPNLRFILTSRDYILRQAQAQSARLGAATVNASEFILNVAHYTRLTRAQILFNHIYFSNLSEAERNQLLEKDFYLKMIDHQNFNPRLIDLLTSADYISMAGRSIQDTVLGVLNNPHELWEKPYRTHISDEGRALMLALFFNATRVSISALEQSFARMVNALSLAINSVGVTARYRSALKELEGSVISIQDRWVSFSNPGVRDFLQAAIRDDKMLDVIVVQLMDFEEISKAWDFYDDQKIPKTDQWKTLWNDGAKRLIEQNSAEALQQVHLLISMYDTLQTDGLLASISTALEILEVNEIDSTDAALSQAVLEQITLTFMPTELQERAQLIVSQAAAKMLRNSGSLLPLDEIKALGDSLMEYGADIGEAENAVRVALNGFSEDLYSMLSEIHSIDEIEEYEDQFNRLAKNYSVNTASARQRFESRKEKLLEGRDYDDEGYGGYGGSQRVDPGPSNDEIRSMFGNLQSK